MAKMIGIVRLGGEHLVAEDSTFLIGELNNGDEVFVAGKPRGTARRVAETLGKDQVFLVCELVENDRGGQKYRVTESVQVLGLAESFGSRNMLPAALPGRFEGWLDMLRDGKLRKVRVPADLALEGPALAPSPTTPPTALGAALGKATEAPATEAPQSTLIDSAGAAKIIAEGIKALRPVTSALVVTDQEREALQEAIGARFPRAAFDSSQAASAQANMERVLQDVQQRRRQAAEIFFAELASFCEGNMALQLGVLGGDLPTLNEKGNPTWGSTLDELLGTMSTAEAAVLGATDLPGYPEPDLAQGRGDDQPEPPPDPEGDKPEDEAEAATAEEGVHPIAAAQEGGVKAEKAAPATTKKPAARKPRKTAAEKAATGTDG